MNVAFQSRRFTRVPSLLTGTQITEQLGINPFAQELFPTIARYFGRYVPGTPNVIVENMPGAGSLVAVTEVIQ